MENLQLSKPRFLGEVLSDVGYGQISRDPQRITESIGFKKALAELGLTEELITVALVEDIKAKPKNRLGEMRLGAEILGLNKREDEPIKQGGNSTYNFIFSAPVQDEIKKIDGRIKAMLIKPKDEPNQI